MKSAKLYIHLLVKECNLPFLKFGDTCPLETHVSFKSMEELETNWQQVRTLIRWEKFKLVQFAIYDLDLVEYNDHPILQEIFQKIDSVDIRYHPYGDGNVFIDEVHEVLQGLLVKNPKIKEICSPSLHPVDVCKVLTWVGFHVESITFTIASHGGDGYYKHALLRVLFTCKVKDVVLLFWDTELTDYRAVSDFNFKRLEYLSSEKYLKTMLLFHSRLFSIDEMISISKFIT